MKSRAPYSSGKMLEKTSYWAAIISCAVALTTTLFWSASAQVSVGNVNSANSAIVGTNSGSINQTQHNTDNSRRETNNDNKRIYNNDAGRNATSGCGSPIITNNSGTMTISGIDCKR